VRGLDSVVATKPSVAPSSERAKPSTVLTTRVRNAPLWMVGPSSTWGFGTS
jgi:hypothetical protein